MAGPVTPEAPNLAGHAASPGLGYSLERLTFISDAVFAIAMTLLALDVRLPTGLQAHTNAELMAALGALGPQILAFVISFVVIAAFWLGHTRIFRVLDRADGRFMWLNLAFLLCVALQPFPTSVVARHGGLSSAVILYAALAGLTGFLSALVWVYAALIAKLTRPTVTREIGRRVAYMALVVPVIFLVSIPIALVNPLIAEVSWGLAGPAELLVSRRLGIHRVLATSGSQASPV